MLTLSVTTVVIIALFIYCTRTMLKKTNRPDANKYLIGSVVCLTCCILNSLWLSHYQQSAHPVFFRYLIQLNRLSSMGIAPLFYVFVMKLFGNVSFRYRWLHFLPAIPALVYVVYFASLSVELRMDILAGINDSHETFIECLTCLFAITTMAYMTYCSGYIYKAWQNEKRQFRNLLDHIHVWIFFLSLCGIAIAFLLLSICIWFNNEDIVRLTANQVSGYMVLLIMLLLVFVNSPLFNRLTNRIAATGFFPVAAGQPDSETLELRDKLEAAIQPALFCKRDLNEAMLAAELTISREKLSEFINMQYSMHFNEFVNTYRIEYFCRQIEDESFRSKKIAVLARECGFSSESTFYDAFRKIKKTTPNHYIREYVSSLSRPEMPD